MKEHEKHATIFPKAKECPPRFPVHIISKTIVIDANHTVYDVWDHNGEAVYTIKYHLSLESI